MSIRKTLVAVTCAAFAVMGTAGTASATGYGHDKGYGHEKGYGHDKGYSRHDADPDSDSDLTVVGKSAAGFINIPINFCGNYIPVMDLLFGISGNGNANGNVCNS